jgi:hypothetical protein
LVEQRIERRILAEPGQPLGVVLDIAAQLAALIVAHQQADDAALRLRLQRHLPLGILQRRAEQRGQRQRLGEQPLDHRRIGMRRQDPVEHRPQPRDAAAGVAARDGEADHAIEIGGGGGIGHHISPPVRPEPVEGRPPPA